MTGGRASAPPSARPSAQSPGSHRPARLPDGARAYAVGDIHGRDDLLAAMIGLIRRDQADRPAARPIALFLGDYVDRGPDPGGVIERLAGGPLPGFEVHCLKGNHEDLMLRFLDGTGELANWVYNGGETTLADYGVHGALGFYSPPDEAACRADLERALPPRHLAFLRGLALSWALGDYLFVHAGVRPGVALAEQDDFDLMWIRDGFLDSAADLGAVVVHGHTISLGPEVRANRIGIDTGAYRTGILTCLVLEGEGRRFLNT